MAREICESADVVSRIVRNRQATLTLQNAWILPQRRLCVLCGRGSSGHAGVFLRYLIETRLHLPVSASAPSVITAFRKPLTLRNALFIVISQSGRSPDLVAATQSARVSVLAPSQSSMRRRRRLPTPPNSSFRSKPGPNILSPRPRRWSARWRQGLNLSRNWPMTALQVGTRPITGARSPRADSRLVQNIRRSCQAHPPCLSLHAVWPELSSRDCAEACRNPAAALLGFSAAELQHGPRAALSSKTPVIMMRLMDETAATVDALARAAGAQIAVHLCGGPRSTLPWLGRR